MFDLFTLPQVELVRQLALARHIPIILVGGAVRDALLDKSAHDLDFSLKGNAVAFARLVADQLGGAFYLMDAERGTARVIVKRDEQLAFHLDFAVCRGSSWDEDLFGRDFSINAIALDVRTREVLDPTGGMVDLPRLVIRQVARHAISDDPVRALRAVRMEHILAGVIERSTEQAVRSAAELLHLPSPERVRDELMKSLALPMASRVVRRMDELSLLSPVAPDMEALRGCMQSLPHHYDALEHTLVTLDYLDEIIQHLSSPAAAVPPWLAGMQLNEAQRGALVQQLHSTTANDRLRAAVLRLGVLLHDIGKPSTRAEDANGVTRFSGHEETGAAMAARRAVALRFSSDEVAQVRTIVRYHMRPNRISREAQGAPPSPRAVYQFMRDTGDCAPELALVCLADGMGKHAHLTPLDNMLRRGEIASLLIERYYAWYSAAAAPPPLLNGRDIMALGVSQGPQIGHILSQIREAEMVGELSSRDAALALAQQLAREL